MTTPTSLESKRLPPVFSDLLESCQWMLNTMDSDGGDAWCSVRNQPGANDWIHKMEDAVKAVSQWDI